MTVTTNTTTATIAVATEAAAYHLNNLVNAAKALSRAATRVERSAWEVRHAVDIGFNSAPHFDPQALTDFASAEGAYQAALTAATAAVAGLDGGEKLLATAARGRGFFHPVA